MDEWYTIVRNFKDESESPYLTETFCNRVFQDLKRSKIRDKKKFRERTGNEFITWLYGLELTYPKSLIMEILNNDEFWLKTLELTIEV
jgi:hypothetical protein